ncbi:cadherin-23-like [Sander lucioperca]|uniref:cadherin-23-like n=1 Tax=Sander lucioperca TaxID=283035 RepID=UPI001653DA41|nr:cadherin-23-like [Sander lucioperca]
MGTTGLAVVGILLAILQVSAFVTTEEPTLNVEHYKGEHKGQNHQHQHTEVDCANDVESAADQQVPILEFPKSGEGLRMRKREWVIPDLLVVENDRGPYPLKLSQVRSNADKVNKIFYSITGPGADQPPVGLFTIDRITGTLYLTQQLDRERKDSYMFQAHAVAEGSANAEAPMDLIVKVIDQNDNRPTFAQDIFLGKVPEASPRGFEVIKVVATDIDQPNTDHSDIRYRLISQEPTLPSDFLFVINPITGVIRVNASGLDREKYPMYTLVVQAADMVGDGLTGEAKVILTVTDSNDNAPASTQPSSATDQQVPILEFPKSGEGLRRKKREWVIPDLTVVENDRGPYPLKVSQIRSNADKVKKIFYSITGPGADQPPVGLFTMDRNTGILYISQPLDREEQDSYPFQAHAVAEGSGNAEASMDITVKVIDQNDNRPTFNRSTFLGEVAEASPTGFEVIKVVATDIDQPNTDNSDIRYRLISQEPTLPSDFMFVINPVTGVIRVNASGLDREKYPMYTLVVQAADMVGDGLAGQAKVILTVTDSNDNAPASTQPSSATDQQVPILEVPKSGEGLRRKKREWIIPDLNVVENDRGPYPLKVAQIRSAAHNVNKIFYSITGPGADQPPVGLFTMDRNTGILYLTQPLDREEQDSYMFQAHAVAEGAGNAEAPMNIIVKVIDQNDNKPTFNQSTFLGEVAEASPTGFEVIKVVATDIDQPNTDNSDIRYSLISQEPTLPSDFMFVINPVTGVIRFNASGLDREKYPMYTLVVQAADMVGDGLAGQAKVILTVTDSNDNAPASTQPSSATDQQVPILEVPKSGEGLRRKKREWIIPDLNVVENDRGPYPLKVAQIRSAAHSVNKIFYSITGPGADQPPVGLFTMDRNTGILYLTQPLDREEQDSYMFQAHAVAEGAGNAEAPMDIIVKVIDQNDNRPTFNQSTFLGEVAEASPRGFEVIKVVATDIDQPNTDNSDIRYSLISQEPTLPSDFMFVINPITGVIRVNAGGLEKEKYPKYTLVVKAADMLGEGLTGEAKVILTVTDSNDNAPAFTQPSYTAAVDENKVNAQILTMSVTDGDEPHSPAWNARFSIVGGDPEGLFTIETGSNNHEGIISTAKGLDFERSSTHALLVAVENEIPFAVPLPTATATVVVTVQDVNEAPVLDPVEKHVVKREALAVDSDVVRYTASEPDTGRTQKVINGHRPEFNL